MTEAELELEASRKELQYLFFLFRSRCGDAEFICYDLTNPYLAPDRRNRMTRIIGGKIRDIEKQVEKLRKEWTRFLELKKKAEQDQ